MEETQLRDPGFWLSDLPWAPGAEMPVVEGEVPGLIFFRTSGSTGEPKWIGLHREALLCSAAAVNRHLGVTASDVWGALLPLHHVGGFGVLARAFEAGSEFRRFHGKWDPRAASAWMEKEQVHHCPMVPTQIHDLVAAKLRAPRALRTVVVGGGSLPDALGRAARNLGWPVLASYGMTEAGSQIATQKIDQLETDYQAFPIPVMAHWRVMPTPDGRLEISGPALFSGMIRRVEGCLKYEPRKGSSFLTSDRVLVEERGISVLGRADRQVKVLGELVDLDDLERILGPDVLVVGLPDARKGQELVLLAIDENVAQRVESHNARVAGPWRIQRWMKVARLPRTPLGKLDRREARRMIENLS
ncbi:O-succinylbenzoic acid--CoA ligase [Haloferula luteola]|uniref:O-succinylbenzoic acid--CoA ligase n=1 Tax=Haloferula luteola TaxID=595692 RepID=A0A840VJ14_9BACT|nr:AMP-binding protein [Haloferula luteola]MBB5352691.1 O-succinylbenzoic acid--CoA ligase [Haloferula luteola]